MHSLSVKATLVLAVSLGMVQCGIGLFEDSGVVELSSFYTGDSDGAVDDVVLVRKNCIKRDSEQELADLLIKFCF